MKLNKKTLTIASIAIAILLSMWGGCKLGQRSCGASVVSIQRDTIYKLVVDTFNVTTKGETIRLPAKEKILIQSDTQLVRLLAETQKKALDAEKKAEYYRSVFEALAEAGVGDVIATEPPHVVKKGTAKSTDGTAIINYQVELYDSTAWVDGDSLRPNPIFTVTGMEMQTSSKFNTDTSKRNAIGVGGMVGSTTNLDKIDVGAMLHVRVGKTTVATGYFVRDRFVVASISRELQWGKKREK